jgi:hypothetical protein
MGSPVNRQALRRAMDLMRVPGAYMLKQQGKVTRYFIVVPHRPIKEIDNLIAEEIKSNLLVIGGRDSLWPGHDQTWRME